MSANPAVRILKNRHMDFIPEPAQMNTSHKQIHYPTPTTNETKMTKQIDQININVSILNASLEKRIDSLLVHLLIMEYTITQPSSVQKNIYEQKRTWK